MAAIETVPLRTRVLDVPVDVCPSVLEAALALHGRGGGQIVTLNAEMTMAALADPALAAVIEAASLVIPDGSGVVWALGRQGRRVRRSPGIELARQLLEHASRQGWRVALVGASPQVIESQITQPLEDSLSGIEGIRTIKSVSREEVSQITVEFVPERNVDSAANDVRDRVARVRNLLPTAADESVISKIEADAQAILWLAFSSEKHDALELSFYADRFVADRLKTLPGVASVIIGGERRYAMRIWLDTERMAA